MLKLILQITEVRFPSPWSLSLSALLIEELFVFSAEIESSAPFSERVCLFVSSCKSGCLPLVESTQMRSWARSVGSSESWTEWFVSRSFADGFCPVLAVISTVSVVLFFFGPCSWNQIPNIIAEGPKFDYMYLVQYMYFENNAMYLRDKYIFLFHSNTDFTTLQKKNTKRVV